MGLNPDDSLRPRPIRNSTDDALNLPTVSGEDVLADSLSVSDFTRAMQGSDIRPDRWEGWIKAGQRGQAQGTLLRTILERSRDVPLRYRLSEYVEECVAASGLERETVAPVLDLDLSDGYRSLDDASFAALAAASLLQLEQEYVNIVLRLACFDPTRRSTIEESLLTDQGLRAQQQHSTVFDAGLAQGLFDRLMESISDVEKQRLVKCEKVIEDWLACG